VANIFIGGCPQSASPPARLAQLTTCSTSSTPMPCRRTEPSNYTLADTRRAALLLDVADAGQWNSSLRSRALTPFANLGPVRRNRRVQQEPYEKICAENNTNLFDYHMQ